MKLVEGEATVENVGEFVAWLDEVGEAHGCTVQAFDANYVVSRAHLSRALDLADRARERGEAVARDRGVEVMLYAAGRRQIDRALELGVREGRGPVVVLVAADGADDSVQAERAAASAVAERLDQHGTLGEFDSERVRAYFDVADPELDATDADLEALVLERVALLDVEK
ncbi:KEOPS complex subunit Cgi121 [Halococcus salsus]|uniref:KEOPS complex subunit Cgi121 n=1 Tax=Halococcus salsus TaxID=2162894 RepID=UPI00135BEA43|nr:KEOPS complex subunit Cgi121 [Halococcus salsus]